MPRPKIPLISRTKALEVALEIVDSEGLDALSIRRLGEALHVNGASLYHHFRNKNEILAGVTQLALADAASSDVGNENWRVWLSLNAYRTRQALIAHPRLIPVLLRRLPLGIGGAAAEANVERLRAARVPLAMIAPLLESLELLAVVGALLHLRTTAAASDVADGDQAVGPNLRAAQQARGLSSDELFEVMVSSTISMVESIIQLKDTRRAVARVRGRQRRAARRQPSGPKR